MIGSIIFQRNSAEAFLFIQSQPKCKITLKE